MISFSQSEKGKIRGKQDSKGLDCLAQKLDLKLPMFRDAIYTLALLKWGGMLQAVTEMEFSYLST